MDKDRVAGTTKKITGTIKEKIGKTIGDAELEADGKADKAVGTIQNVVGKSKDKVRDAVKK